MGTWRRERIPGPNKRSSDPWMIEWTKRKRERERNAVVERVERVRGRKRRICVTVENLVRHCQ
jgi:hypothetical protein